MKDTESIEFQSDVKQTANVGCLFVRSSIFKSIFPTIQVKSHQNQLYIVKRYLKNLIQRYGTFLGEFYFEGSELGLSLEDDEDSFVVPYSFLWRESETE